MSRALLVVAAAGAVALAAARPAAVFSDNLQIGQSAPAFHVNTTDGLSLTGNFGGRPVYINVFATWCPPCRRELPSVIAHAKQYRDRIVFLFVDEQEPPNVAKQFASSLGVVMPVAIDPGQFAATFGVGGLPWSIFIDRRGIVQYIYRGNIPPIVLDDQLSKLASS
ncbi:MAG: TlpA family protein disulfide reductase [Candidatus Eremiobacteraeota bacterium]|nr:TlpA family protein disulfide reductase [Candidatus Eremiobacteraeota bacterium]